jgi:hypothetical protein
MPSIGQTWVLVSIGAVVEMGVLSTLKRLLMESRIFQAINDTQPKFVPNHVHLRMPKKMDFLYHTQPQKVKHDLNVYR